MKKRLTALALAVVMLAFGLPMPLGAASMKSAVPEYSDLLLYADLYRLSAVGHQASGGYACSCFALAYARTITDGRVHYYSEYNAYGADQYNVSAVWSSGEYYRSEFTDKTEALTVLYEEVRNQRPVLAYVEGRGSVQHYVTVIGFEDVTSFEELSEENFLILDPAPSSVFSVENMGDVGYSMKRSGYGSDSRYLLIRPFESVPTADIDSAVPTNRRYVSECTQYPSSVLLEITDVAFPYTLPCYPSTAASYDCVSEALLDYPLYEGERLEAEGLYENTDGQYWYRCLLPDETEAFFPAECCEMVRLIPPVLVDGSFPERITGATYLEGTIRSKAMIRSIQAKVYRAGEEDGEVLIASDNVRIDAKAYSLKYSAVDYTLPFQKLKQWGAGSYTLVYEAEHTNHYADGEKLMTVTRCDVIESYPFHYGEEEPSVCEITFDPGGGVCSVLRKTVEIGAPVGELPIPERDGYSFDGWFTAKQGGERVLPEDIISKDIILYAQWSEGPHTHSFQSELTLPTCEEKGFTSYQCGCGYSFKTDYTAALGHFYSDGICIRCSSEDPFFSPDTETDVVFLLGKAKGKPGETIRVPVTVRSRVEVNSIAFYRLTYDKDLLEFVGFEDYGEMEKKAFVSFFDSESEMITVGLLEAEVLNCQMCSLVFRIREDALCDVSSEIHAFSVVKMDSEHITSSVLEGSVNIRTQRSGDIDGDDLVDIRDSLLLFRHSMMPDLYPVDYEGSVDFNGDGAIDLLDALLLFRHSMLPDMYPIE